MKRYIKFTKLLTAILVIMGIVYLIPATAEAVTYSLNYVTGSFKLNDSWTSTHIGTPSYDVKGDVMGADFTADQLEQPGQSHPLYVNFWDCDNGTLHYPLYAATHVFTANGSIKTYSFKLPGSRQYSIQVYASISSSLTGYSAQRDINFKQATIWAYTY